MKWGDVVDGDPHAEVSDYVQKTVKVVISNVAAFVERLHFPAGPVKRNKKNRQVIRQT